jgi:hypothetical protein
MYSLNKLDRQRERERVREREGKFSEMPVI